jgi:hypothetical protein
VFAGDYQEHIIMKAKKTFFLLFISFGFTLSVISTYTIQNNEIVSDQLNHPRSSKLAFKSGEKLKYLLHYGIINAGLAELYVYKSKKKFKGSEEAFNMVGKGWTTGATDWFFKVDDHYETYMDADKMDALQFIRRVNEGGFIINQDYYFDTDSNKVLTQDNKKFDVPMGVQDMLSTFYYARTIDYSKAKVDDIFIIPAFVDNEVEYLRIIYKGRETIKTKSGKYKCLKFNPLVLEGRVFKDDEDLSVWITDDDNKIPILIESKVIVGSIKAELINYEGLAHPIAKLK